MMIAALAIGEAIAIIGMGSRRIAAYIALDRLQAIGAHHGRSIDPIRIVDGIITAQGDWKEAPCDPFHRPSRIECLRQEGRDTFVEKIDGAGEGTTTGTRPIGDLLDDGITNCGACRLSWR